MKKPAVTITSLVLGVVLIALSDDAFLFLGVTAAAAAAAFGGFLIYQGYNRKAPSFGAGIIIAAAGVLLLAACLVFPEAVNIIGGIILLSAAIILFALGRASDINLKLVAPCGVVLCAFALLILLLPAFIAILTVLSGVLLCIYAGVFAFYL